MRKCTIDPFDSHLECKALTGTLPVVLVGLAQGIQRQSNHRANVRLKQRLQPHSATCIKNYTFASSHDQWDCSQVNVPKCGTLEDWPRMAFVQIHRWGIR